MHLRRFIHRAAATLWLWPQAACFDPEGAASGDTTTTPADTTGTETSVGPTTSTTDPTLDPTTSTAATQGTDTTSGSTSTESTGECVGEGCPCVVDGDCDRGLVCRDDSCQPLVCGDGLIEGPEQCDDTNRRDVDGCDADCTHTEILDIEVAYTRTCALIEGGLVRCWGLNDSGQLGYGNTDQIGDDETPADAGDVMLPGPAEQLTTGDQHNCVLVEGGDVICWGAGFSGQLGYANTNSIGDDEFPSTLPAVDVGAVNLQVVAGGSQSCSLGMAGTVRCWGAGFNGQLGYGNFNSIGDDESPSTAGTVPVGAAVIDVCAGIGHTCAVLSNGNAKCWGNGFAGQLGYGNTNTIGDDETPSTQPPLDFVEDAVAISCGLQHSCALFEGGAVRCWGDNSQGQLGQGNLLNLGDDETVTTVTPIPLAGVAVSITSGDNHNCVRLDDGTIRCWGANSRGQLGLGSIAPIGDDELPDTIGVVEVGAPVLAVDAGGDNTCVIFEDHRLRCWGWNDYGQNGYGHTMTLGDDELPSAIPDVPLLVAL